MHYRVSYFEVINRSYLSRSPFTSPGDGERPERADPTADQQLARVRRRVQQKLDAANTIVANLKSTLGVIHGVERRVTPEWTIDELREWLASTRTAAGATLESRLESRSLDAQIQAYVRAFARGPRGFHVDVSKLRFPHDTSTLARLREGIDVGAITGIVIEAYPDAAQLLAISERLNPADPRRAFEKLQHETGLEFLMNHFLARRGKLLDVSDSRAHLRAMRWPRPGGKPIWSAFHERAAENGHDTAWDFLNPHDALSAHSTPTQAYKDVHRDIAAGLDDQPALVEMLGTVSMVFANSMRDVPETAKILAADGVTRLAQGDGLSFIALLQQRVDTLTPAEHLALTIAMSTPANASTYPNQRTRTWLAGIGSRFAAQTGSYSDGMDLSWSSVEGCDSGTRVRSVVRP